MRTHEIGIRIAVGAQTGDVLRLIIRDGMTLTFIGMIIGQTAALVLTRLLKTLLFGINANDWVT